MPSNARTMHAFQLPLALLRLQWKLEHTHAHAPQTLYTNVCSLHPGNEFGKANDAGAVSGAGAGENAYEMSQNLLALARLRYAKYVYNLFRHCLFHRPPLTRGSNAPSWIFPDFVPARCTSRDERSPTLTNIGSVVELSQDRTRPQRDKSQKAPPPRTEGWPFAPFCPGSCSLAGVFCPGSTPTTKAIFERSGGLLSRLRHSGEPKPHEWC